MDADVQSQASSLLHQAWAFCHSLARTATEDARVVILLGERPYWKIYASHPEEPWSSVVDELAMHNSSPIPAFTSPSSESSIASPEIQSDRPDSCDCKSLRCQLRLSHRELEMQRQVYVVDVARLEKSLSAEKAQRLALETRFDNETREGQHTVLQDRITELQRGNEKLWREIQLERARRQQTLSESARLVVQTRKQIEERDRCLRAMRSALTKSDGHPRLRAVADVEHEFSQLSEMHRSLVNKAKNDHRHEEGQET